MKQTSEKDQFTELFFCLDECCRRVAEKYGKPGSSEWSNLDYIKLSGLLFRETAVQISPSTLKRVYGKIKTPQRYFPQSATRDALAQFGGFNGWDDLVDKTMAENPELPRRGDLEISPLLEQTNALEEERPGKRKTYWYLGLIIVVGVIIWIILKPHQTKTLWPGMLKLECHNPDGESPHSAYFKIKQVGTGNIDPSGLTILYGDDKIGYNLSLNNSFSHYYERPGRYFAILKYRDQLIDTAVIYLKTNNWVAVASMERDTTRVYPIGSGKIIENGKMTVSAADLYKSGVDTNHTFFVEFSNVKPLDIDGDNFELTAHLNTSLARSGVRCSQVDIRLFGEKSQISPMLILPGCVSWANLIISEMYIDGDKEELNFLGADLRSGGTIKIRVVEKNLSLLVNDKVVYLVKYKFPLKKLYGIQFMFAGIGAVDNYSVKDLKTGKMIGEDFSVMK